MTLVTNSLFQLEALFDQFYVGAWGHYLGESSAYHLSNRPRSPLKYLKCTAAKALLSHIHEASPDPTTTSSTSSSSPATPLPIPFELTLENAATVVEYDSPALSQAFLRHCQSRSQHRGGSSEANGRGSLGPSPAGSCPISRNMGRGPARTLSSGSELLSSSIPHVASSAMPSGDRSSHSMASLGGGTATCNRRATASHGSPFDSHGAEAACRLVDEFLDRPRLSTVQGLFLLGKHIEENRQPGDVSKSYVYIGMAIRLAHDMGLNRDSSGWGLHPTQVEYRHRTWWYLYVYDRFIGVSMGRPFLIQDHDCETPRPSIDPRAKDAELDRHQVEYFCHLIQLCSIIGSIMVTFYSGNCLIRRWEAEQKKSQRSSRGQPPSVSATAGPVDDNSGQARKKAKIVPPRAQRGSCPAEEETDQDSIQQRLLEQSRLNSKILQLMERPEEELAEWEQSLPKHLQWGALNNTSNVYGDILQGLYHAAQILLHRPYIKIGELLPATHSRVHDVSLPKDSPRQLPGRSMTICSESARKITTLTERCLYLTHLDRFGSGCLVLLQAARQHLMIAAKPCVQSIVENHAFSVSALGENNTAMDTSRSDAATLHFDLGALQRREEAVDLLHKTLASLRKLSVYHWTVNGIGRSIQAFERTLAAILQEQENGLESEDGQRLPPWLRKHEFSAGDDMDNEASAMRAETESVTSSTNSMSADEEHQIPFECYESMSLLEYRLSCFAYHGRSKISSSSVKPSSCPFKAANLSMPTELAEDPSIRAMSAQTIYAAEASTSPRPDESTVYSFNSTETQTNNLAPVSTPIARSSTEIPTRTSAPNLVFRSYIPDSKGRLSKRRGVDAVDTSPGPGVAPRNQSRSSSRHRKTGSSCVTRQLSPGATAAEGSLTQVSSPDSMTFPSTSSVAMPKAPFPSETLMMSHPPHHHQVFSAAMTGGITTIPQQHTSELACMSSLMDMSGLEVQGHRPNHPMLEQELMSQDASSSAHQLFSYPYQQHLQLRRQLWMQKERLTRQQLEHMEVSQSHPHQSSMPAHSQPPQQPMMLRHSEMSIGDLTLESSSGSDYSGYGLSPSSGSVDLYSPIPSSLHDLFQDQESSLGSQPPAPGLPFGGSMMHGSLPQQHKDPNAEMNIALDAGPQWTVGATAIATTGAIGTAAPADSLPALSTAGWEGGDQRRLWS
ncbi:hypothetical protein BGW38_004431 [Lunasporangiospora selenospora]|uniref:Xylanolytic transcriptional activator regulatory domain-containing protein n=1 Tax=Lunasporangiospora selenospora TaxID=979761 RepID=A0A9P6FRC5_9FUNG|nr:hypothetical protein BGW38_004431 [Lunasporangiospora selenospora]